MGVGARELRGDLQSRAAQAAALRGGPGGAGDGQGKPAAQTGEPGAYPGAAGDPAGAVRRERDAAEGAAGEERADCGQARPRLRPHCCAGRRTGAH